MKFQPDYYYKRVARGVNNAFAEKYEDLPDAVESFYEVIRPGSHTFKRVYGLINFIRKVLPENVWKKIGPETFRNFSHFPFDLNQYEVKQRLGSGATCDCFLFEPIDKNKYETWALKIIQNSGDNLIDVENKAKQVKEDYETLSAWYQQMENLIPKQMVLISENFQLPKRGPVVMILQEFLGSSIKDLIKDFNEKEWEELSQKNPHIKDQVKQFALITKNNLEKHGMVPDILGYSNLSIVDVSNSPRLVFLDPDGISKLDEMKKTKKFKYEQKLLELYKRAGIV